MENNQQASTFRAVDQANRAASSRQTRGALIGLGIIVAVAAASVLAIWLNGTW